MQALLGEAVVGLVGAADFVTVGETLGWFVGRREGLWLGAVG